MKLHIGYNINNIYKDFLAQANILNLVYYVVCIKNILKFS